MPRVTNSVARKKKHKKVLKQAKGYYGARSRLYRTAKQALEKGMLYNYRDRRRKKGDFRKLWITRINAAARLNGTTYSKLISGLSSNGVQIDRKMLSDLAVREPKAFAEVVKVAVSS
ncbi:MAG: 50S ribosomal protein L20 [Candidatus Marinimicrobia bacterium]|nr:50S ribosomal protein L20 [Candidatus Neomarinimicrobiota bacterium]|tara:strand:- start:2523 stop:2873 length:351 start_codon:yes stop_codon:yes gene_type:complete